MSIDITVVWNYDIDDLIPKASGILKKYFLQSSVRDALKYYDNPIGVRTMCMCFLKMRLNEKPGGPFSWNLVAIPQISMTRNDQIYLRHGFSEWRCMLRWIMLGPYRPDGSVRLVAPPEITKRASFG